MGRLLPTPTAKLYANNRGGAAGRLGKVRPSLEVLTGGPWISFREFLMGWPIGWTTLELLATGRFQEWLHWHGGASRMDKPMIRYSPTQLSMFMSCARKWHFAYPQGFKAPTTKSQALGKEIHAAIEEGVKYILSGGAEGVMPTDTRALAGLSKLYEDGLNDLRAPDDIEVESNISIYLDPSKVDGTPRQYIGIIDHYDVSDRYLPIITDHKTTSNMKYAKTEFELQEDVQMISYAKYAFDNEPQADEVKVQHNVIPTYGAAKAELTEAIVTRAHVEKKWSEWLPILDQMDIALTQEVHLVNPDGLKNGECQRFGGCPHQSRCLSVMFRGAGNMKAEGKNMAVPVSIMERLNAAKAKVGASSGAPTKAGPNVPASRAALDSASDEPKTGKPSAVEKIARAKAAQKAAQEAAKEETIEEVIEVGGEEVIEVVDEDVQDQLARLRAKMGKTSGPKVVPKTGPKTDAGAGAKAPREAAETGGKYLFLNCAPTQGLQATPLEVFMAPLLARIQQETGKNWQQHEFRQGPGFIADCIQATALPEVLQIDTTTPLGKVCLESIRPRVQIVIEGGAR